MNQRSVVVIPARYASKRLPGKPLIKLSDKPLIQWVYQRALQISQIERVMVVTDDKEIQDTVVSFGGEAFLTPSNIKTGSDRVGFLVREMEADIIVNLQGDEPLISPDAVGKAVQALKDDDHLNVSTLGYVLRSQKRWRDPSVVKVVVDNNMNALYFSRASIPFHQETNFQSSSSVMQHIGVYVYRKSFLLEYLTWPQGLLEKVEKLEQLRILEQGYKIKVIPTNTFSPGIDTPEDVALVEKLIKEKGINR